MATDHPPFPNDEEVPSGSLPEFRFDELPSPLRENVAGLGWAAPMPVQAQTIPMMMEGRDLVVQSRTGSGKTGAFLLPLCRRVDLRDSSVQGLVLSPTRELAEQVHSVLVSLTKETQIRTVAVYGGAAYGPQIEAFQRKVQVVVGTPGRIIDHLKSGRVSLSHLRFLVLDEADELLSMGFYKSIMEILAHIPPKRQTALFSATIPPGVVNLARRFTRDAEWISLSGDRLHVEEVDHVYYVVDAMYKDRALLKIIEMENPEAALIFCNTKREVEYLGTFLKNFGYDSDILSGDLSQAERDEVMRRIRQGKLRFPVATDVAARGIDLSQLGYVVLYNLPQAHDHYIHRAGRTGRAGESGIAISLVSPLEEMELERRAKRSGLTLIKKALPSDEEVERKVSERLTVMIEEEYRHLSNLEKERMRRFLPLAKSLFESGESVETVAMLFDRFYHATLHQPLYTPEERIAREQADSQKREKPAPTRKRSGRGRDQGDRSRGPRRRR